MIILPTRLETLQARLDQYILCEASILGGAQQYSIGSRSLTRANLKEIADMIRYLERQVAIEEAKQANRGRNRMVGVIPRDI